MPRIPLPKALATGAFRVDEARALDIRRGRLRGPDLGSPFHGVRATDSNQVALAYLPLLRPGDRFSHTTAAALWPLPLPPGLVGLHVSSTPPRNPPRRPGVTGHLSPHGRSIRRASAPVSDAVALFLELATMLSEDDLVAVGDALILDPAVLGPHDIRPWITIEELTRGCSSARSHGSRAARRAIARMRQGAESREETLVRLLLLDAALPEPELNLELLDAHGVIGRFDLVYRSFKVIVEYDGDQHRTDRAQYERDMTRIDRAIAAGWTVVRVRAWQLHRRPSQVVERVRKALKL